MVFTSIFFGWPGRSHDAYVFRQSSLGQNLENGSIQLPLDVHIVGDSAYPLHTYLLIPFKDNGNLTREQKNYNYRLSSSRVIIEQAFGLLVKKFKILNHLHFRNYEKNKYIVTACVILHNFILLQGKKPKVHCNETTNTAILRINKKQAIEKRNCIVNLLYA